MIYYFLKNKKKTAFVMKSFLSQSFNVVTLTSEKIT